MTLWTCLVVAVLGFFILLLALASWLEEDHNTED
jgi:hypothetical protein